ncbi:DUF1989 domain-containing protein [Paenibacillus sinopodophylli]|uniref:DUF1989 domain-containing protein n=1 Tax=Paenibacillus sinopodophylli TaxID=1837342 RepID=UPI00110CACFE|nr:urea carboxylase-associated family protein [Paenibacillus sinopodophylli]
MNKQKWLIPASKGLGFRLEKGQIIKVTDLEGEQVADFVAFNADDYSERLDPGVTMDALHTMDIEPGDHLYSNKYKPILTVIADTVGKHDFINSACRSEMYEVLYNKQGHASCYGNLSQALAPFHVPSPDQYYPFNLFMNTVIASSGQISVERPLSKAGDYIELRAEMDVIIAISACPCAESACNGFKCTAIEAEIL